MGSMISAGDIVLLQSKNPTCLNFFWFSTASTFWVWGSRIYNLEVIIFNLVVPQFVGIKLLQYIFRFLNRGMYLMFLVIGLLI